MTTLFLRCLKIIPEWDHIEFEIIVEAGDDIPFTTKISKLSPDLKKMQVGDEWSVAGWTFSFIPEGVLPGYRTNSPLTLIPELA